jgi:hypothetical protein
MKNRRSIDGRAEGEKTRGPDHGAIFYQERRHEQSQRQRHEQQESGCGRYRR